MTTKSLCLRENKQGSRQLHPESWPDDDTLKRVDALATDDALRQRHGQRLVSVSADLRRVEASSRVGFIALDKFTVEVYPKYISGDWSEVRREFTALLEYSRVFDLWPGVPGCVDRNPTSLGEWVLRGIALQLVEALARGIPRSYVLREEPLLAIRGRIDLGTQVRQSRGIDLPIHCRFDEHLTDSPLLRLLALLAEIILLRCHTQPTRSLALQARRELADVDASFSPEIDFQALHWTRHTEHFAPSTRALRLLIDGGGQSWAAGRSETWSVSVPMEVVFERYVGRLLRDICVPASSVMVQKPVGHLGVKPQQFKQVADFVVAKKDEVTIIDSKYKVPCELLPAESDVRQVLTYAALWNQQDPPVSRCRRVVLVYPREYNATAPAPCSWKAFLRDTDDGDITIISTTVPFGRSPGREDLKMFAAHPEDFAPGLLI